MKHVHMLLLLLLAGFIATAQWTTDVSVNTEASNTATGDCKMITTTSGKTWLAYFKQVPAPNYYEMRAQLLDKDGVKLLGPGGVLVNNAPHPSFTTIFCIATDLDNNLIVAFANASTNTIFVNKVDTIGVVKWNAPATAFNSGLFPRIGILKNNDIVISWISATGTKAQMQKLAGSTGLPQWPAPLSVETAITTHRSAPANLFPLSGTDFLLVFHNRASSFGVASTIWAQRYNASGIAQWPAPVQLTDKTTSYNREYFPVMHNDTLFLGYHAATGLRLDAFLQRINPDGTRPWGMNGIDFSLDNAYYEQETRIVIIPATNSVWACSRITNTSQGSQGVSVQKFNKLTGARQFTDNGKVVYAIAATPSIVPYGISVFSDNKPVLLLGKYNTAVSQFLYASKLDDNGAFLWAGDTIALAKFPVAKGRITLTDVVNNQAVAVWVENKGTVDLPYAQPIRIDGATGLAAPIPSFNANLSKVCTNIPVQFTNTSIGFVTNYSWSFPGGTPSTSTIPNPTVTYGAPGVYPVTLTVSNAGGSNSITRNDVITVTGVTVSAGPDETIIAGDEVMLRGVATNATTVAWTPANTLNNAALVTPIAKPSTTTTYLLTASNADNCTATDNVTITVVPSCIKIMNAFTPNGDGYNDRWLVLNGTACTKQTLVAVYNRYGQKVYSNDNYENNWDGTYKGKPVADGTYYYTITYRLINSKSVTLKGDVTILR